MSLILNVPDAGQELEAPRRKRISSRQNRVSAIWNWDYCRGAVLGRVSIAPEWRRLLLSEGKSPYIRIPALGAGAEFG